MDANKKIDGATSDRVRRLAGALEPFAGQVYFSPECHEEYARLGFDPSTRSAGGVQFPDGPAYFCSRGSCMGQVPGEVVASAFAVFDPLAVVPAVTLGWTRTDAETIAAARTRGAVAQLRRVLGDHPTGIERVGELLGRGGAGLRPEGRPLFAGLLALGLDGDPVTDAWRLADRLREFRGDCHTAAWTSAGIDATEIGLLTELYWGLPMRTYVRTRAWTDHALDAAEGRLRDRGLLEGDGLSAAGREFREDVEIATDVPCATIVEALGADFDELLAMLLPWGEAIRAAGGYPASGPHDLASLSS